ncbi:MATE family efflux transporter [Methanobrevibacter sp.]|uniref:MATE family efflux transporter n=1 Tax=Methanobrevibacter sp. TaxID=66852 RepID=UPI0038903D92
MYQRRYDLLSSKFREFFLPTLMTSMAGNICLFVDSIIVSFLIGAVNLSAIQVASPLITFVNLIYWMVGLGGSVLCSIAKSEFDEDKSNSIFSVSIMSLIVLGVIVLILGLLTKGTLIPMLTTSKQIIPLVDGYFTVLLFGMPFLCYLMSLSYFVRADGLPNLAFRSILLSNIVNIIMDFVYIKFFGFGIGGAALATTTGYAVGSIYVSTYFFRSERTLKFYKISKIKLHNALNYFKNIAVSGFSSASTQLFFTVQLIIYNAVIGVVLGKYGLTAYSVCRSCSFIIYIFLIGASQTMSPIVSVYYQEEDYSGVDYVVKKALKIALGSSIALILVFTLVPQTVLTLYSVNDPNIIPVVVNALRIFMISFVGVAVTFLFTFYTQAIKRNSLSLSTSIIEGFVAPIALLFILNAIIGSNGIWLSFVGAEVITIIYIFISTRYISKKTNGEYGGFFINKKIPTGDVLDLTVDCNLKETVGVAQHVEKYLKDLGTDDRKSMIVSLSIEEMLVNIINTNEDLDSIDVLVKIQEEHILVSIKDQGVEFNPVIENENLEFDNISVLNKIADKIDYARVLGFNSTVITIKNS